MPGSSGNSSFIPKRGTSKHKRKIHKGKVYSLTIISYVLLFAALAASAAVYVYSGIVRTELDAESKAMNEAWGAFRESDMQRIQEFDQRLRQAHQRLNSSVSINSIFAAIEKATVDTARFDKFSLQRNLDEGFVVQAEIETDSFDSTIFQREIYGDNETVSVVEIIDLAIQGEISEEGETGDQSITFKALMAFPLSAVPYQASPAEANNFEEPPEPVSPPLVGDTEVDVEPPAEPSEEVEVNQTDV